MINIPFSQKEKCPAWGEKCRNCGGRNHFAKKCPMPTKKINSLREKLTDSDSDIGYITSIAVKSETVHVVTQGNYAKEIYGEMLVEGQRVKFQVDSGASVNVIPAKFVKGEDMQPTKKVLQMWNDPRALRG